MATAIVMPCLNEEVLLRQTCLSLGFGRGINGSADPFLVLVDNGSSDRTPEIMAAVRDGSPAGAVHIVEQRDRGYVPARHAGVLAAADIAGQMHHSDAFVLQVDADTVYSDDYVHRMTRAFLGNADSLIEGASVVHRDFRQRYPGFHQLSESVDTAVIDHTDEADSVIVPDAICGFSLSNYFRWGGHRREYLSNGEEIYAETTRLYIRARLMGCTKFKDSHALAFQSRRKVVANPGMHFSCAGFPRGQQWRERWQATHPGRIALDDFEAPDAAQRFSRLLTERRSHLIVLFVLLPAALGISRANDRFAEDVLPCMLSANADAANCESTAPLFERAFQLIDDTDQVESCFARITQPA